MALAINGGTPVRTRPFTCWPIWGNKELDNLYRVITSGIWGCLTGEETSRFERRFAAAHQAEYGICVNSGTTALRLALLAAGNGAGDEVIVPAYTFFASASAVIEVGAIPVFIDIDPKVTSHSYHLFVFRYQQSYFADKSKASFIRALHKEGIPVHAGYPMPLYRQPVFVNKAFWSSRQSHFHSCRLSGSTLFRSGKGLLSIGRMDNPQSVVGKRR